MKKLLLSAVAVMMTAFSVNAQVKIESPSPDLDVKVTRSTLSGSSLFVDITVTNYSSSEQEVYFYGGLFDTIAYDDEGMQYGAKPSIITIGLLNQELKNMVKPVLIPDVPTKIRLQIPNINSNASKIELLKIAVRANNGSAIPLSKDNPIKIRNIEWIR